MNKILIPLLLLIATNLAAQKNGSYLYLSLQEFLKFNTEVGVEYYKTIYKDIKYPSEEQELRVEAIVRVTMINHSKENFELIISGTTHQGFIEEVENVVSNTNRHFLIPSEIKYLTEFYIDFDFEPFNEEINCEKKDEVCNYLKLRAYKPIIHR